LKEPQEVDLALEAGDLRPESREARFEGPVPFAEAIDRQGILLVEAVELVGLLCEALPIPNERREVSLFLREDPVPLGEVGSDGLRGERGRGTRPGPRTAPRVERLSRSRRPR